MAGPFGVEIPDNFGATDSASQSDTAPEGAQSAPAGDSASAKETETREPQVQDLDSLERFRFQGKELSRDDLQRLLSGESKSESESGNARFDSNFRYDLAAVLDDPSKLSAFRGIYPAEYVQIVERALAAQRSAGQKASPESQASVKQDAPADPRIERLEKIAEQWEAAQKEQRVGQITSALDKSFDKFSKKYPDADPEVINSRLYAIRQMGTELQDRNGKLREEVIEKLFKDDNAARAKAYEDKYRAKVEAQKRANSQARDVGQGGATSSPAGKQPRTLKEATANALAHLEGR